MKKSHFVALVFAVLACLASELRAGDRQEIKTLEDRQFSAFKARDIDGYMACFVADETLFVFDGAGPPREYVGPTSWRKYIAEFFASSSGPIRADYRNFALVTEGKLAFAHYVVDEAFTLNGQSWSFTERWTDVFRKVHGKWLIVHEHTSFPLDFESGKPDLSSSK